MKGARLGAREGPASASQRARLADEHHAKGYSCRKQGDFAAAIEEYSQAIALEPHHFKALFNRGFSWDKVYPTCRCDRRSFSPQMQQPSSMARLAAHCTYRQRVKHCLLISSDIGMQIGDYERAVEDYSQALQVDPGNSYAYYNRGITRDRSGDYEGAIADFTQAIRLDPANADFFHNRGFSLRKLVGKLVAKWPVAARLHIFI